MKKIFILHGWTYSIEKWQPLIEELKRINFETVMLRIPGLTEPLDKIWDIDDYVEWLKKKTSEEKEKIILLGHSNGGRISLCFALKYPEKISNIILIDSAGIYHNELSIRIKRLVFGLIAKMGRGIRDVKPIRRLFYRLIMEHDYEKADPILRRTMRNLINHDVSKILDKITVPVTIIWGENDSITPLKDGKLMNRKIKNSKLYIIENARHSPQFTNVEKIIEIIKKEI